MKCPAFLPVVAVCAFPALVWAVYAPIPEQEQGRAFAVRLGGSVHHDSNIFGSAQGAIDSLVFSFAPSLAYNGSLTDQTFLSAGYDLRYDHVQDRPGKQNLTSHTGSLRLAHAFSDATNVDVSDRYMIAKNPESLLAGVPLNTDQSFKMNEFNARFATAAGAKGAVVAKYRNLDMAYDTGSLAAQLDRRESLAGLEAAFRLLPETKLVGEYRYLDIAYASAGALKDKRSHFFLAGLDHSPSEAVTLTARAGAEDRTRDGAADTTAPYAELSGRYAYAEGSFVSGGYLFTLEEPSDVVRFTDTKVNRLFVNVQHRLSALVTASSSLTYEPSQLQGRAGLADLDETVTRVGLALSWTPTKNWIVSATCDLDQVASDDAARDQERTRLGVDARFSF